MGRHFLVTGGAGFIGSNFIRYLRTREPDAQITNIDALTYAGVRASAEELDDNPKHQFFEGDIRDVQLVDRLMPGQDVVVHFAAESHVDRSIEGPLPFLESNVVGTGVLLDAARRHSVARFVHVSTDEVYGSIQAGFAVENDPLAPSSPYAASKAGADLLALSYAQTYDYGPIITRCTNNFGPYQFPEKAIPTFITRLIENMQIPLYGEGRNERDWLYVEDHCSAIHMLVDKGEPGEIYNIGANNQLTNLDLAQRILATFSRDDSWIDFVKDRPGHDLRYAVDSSKIRSFGWEPSHAFDDRLASTIEWYLRREDWWRPLQARI